MLVFCLDYEAGTSLIITFFPKGMDGLLKSNEDRPGRRCAGSTSGDQSGWHRTWTSAAFIHEFSRYSHTFDFGRYIEMFIVDHCIAT